MPQRHHHPRQQWGTTSFTQNPYQPSTLDHPIPHSYRQKNGRVRRNSQRSYQEDPHHHATSCPSDDTISYYNDINSYETLPSRVPSRHPELAFSDRSDSPRFPYYEDISTRRLSSHQASERSFNNRTNFSREGRHSMYQKDFRRIYAVHESPSEAYQELERGNHSIPPVSHPLTATPSMLSERPVSSQNSSITSNVIHACGGRCRTIESVCYYFLQVAFIMGILIGASLVIAGSVLRKSASRNLQVLVYIGSLLSMVSLLLLSIQCHSKRHARRRKNVIKGVRRSPIGLDQLPVRVTPSQLQQQQQPMLVNDSLRGIPVTIVPVPMMQQQIDLEDMEEQPGIPWWRRKDIV